MKTKIYTLLTLLVLQLTSVSFAQTIWTGNNSGEWSDSLNWTAGVPTISSDAIIAFPSSGNWAVITGNAICKNLTVESGSYLGMGNNSKLIMNGRIINEGTFDGGGGTIEFQGSSSIIGYCTLNHIQISGELTAAACMQVNGDFENNGVFNANQGCIKFFGNTHITGTSSTNFYAVENYGVLTGSSGLISISGSMVNNGSFISNNGSVRFNGTAEQTLGMASETTFNNLIIENAGSGVSLTGSVKVNTSLQLKSGYLNLNANNMLINNSSTAAISRINGCIISESGPLSGNSFIKWNIGSGTGNYTFPFGTADGLTMIPVQVNITTAGQGNGTLALATYSTDVFNEPYPDGVTNVYDSTGSDYSQKIVDRFWITKMDGYSVQPISNITFTSTVNEIGLIQNLVSKKWDGIEWVDAASVQQPSVGGVCISNVQEYTTYTLFEGQSKRDDENPPSPPQTTTGIANAGNSGHAVKLYPNVLHDASQYVHISGLNSADAGLQVTDINGKEVFHTSIHTEKGNEHQFSLQGKELPSGMYYVHISDGTNSSTQALAFIQ